MRAIAMVLALAVSAPAAAAEKPASRPSADCPRTSSHFATNGSMYRGDRVAPRKLTQLPPAVGYMAVYRTVNGCEAPLTIVEYRRSRRP